MSHLRPAATKSGGTFPAVVITTVQSARATLQDSTDLDDILGNDPPQAATERRARKAKTLAEALRD